jgi:hypothetical protein
VVHAHALGDEGEAPDEGGDEKQGVAAEEAGAPGTRFTVCHVSLKIALYGPALQVCGRGGREAGKLAA